MKEILISMILKPQIFIISALILIFSDYSKAQQLSDTIKIGTVDVYARKLIKEDAGKTITKVDSVAMLNAITSTLSDLVSRNTPIFIKEYGRGAMATASFRGTAPSHTEVTWNGVPLNSPMLGMVDFSAIPVYFTDNVSLLHGAASLASGNGALGGLVKLENTTDWSRKFSGRALSGLGSYGTKDRFVKFDLGNKKFRWQTRAYNTYSDNNFIFKNKLVADIDPVTGAYNYPEQRNVNSNYDNYGFLQELYFRSNDKNMLILRYWYQHNDRGIPRLLTNETDINSNISRQTEDSQRPVAEWRHYGRKGTFNIMAGANLQQLHYLLTTNVSGKPVQSVIDSYAKSSSYLFRLNYKYDLKKDLSISVGAYSTFDKVQSVNSPQVGATLTYDKSRLEQTFLAQVSKQINEKISINIVAKEEIVGNITTPVIPSAGFEIHPLVDKGVFLKGNVARNYHQPTLNDLYFNPGGNPDLKPEEGIMAEFGGGYSGTSRNSNFHTSLNLFSSQINNWIIWLPSTQGYWQPFNMKRVDAAGLELNAGIDGLYKTVNYHLNGNYSLTRSVNQDDPKNWADESIGKQLPYIPVHSANLLAEISRSNFHLSWQWTYYSERYITTSNDRTSKLTVIYPYFMNNLFLSKEIKLDTQKLAFELKVNNLFNEDYHTVLQYPMPRRNYAFIIRYDF